jgi:spore coat protein U-like protein
VPKAPRPRLVVAGLGAAFALAGLPLTAHAATSITTFSVTAQVTTTCGITASNLNFGIYTGVQVDATTTLSATCSDTTPYNVGLNAGTTTGATVTTRKMAGPATDLLGYQLFSDTGRTTNWGNTVGTDTVASTGTGLAQTLTVYGRIPAGQFIQSGAYDDTITVTLTF